MKSTLRTLLLRASPAALCALVILVPCVAPVSAVDFPAPELVPSTGGPRGLAAGHLDGDGLLDLAATSPLTGRILLHPGDGEGGFLSPRSQLVGGAPVALAAVDFDGDALTDLVWVDEASGDIGLMLQRATLPVSYELRRRPGADEPCALLLRDFDQDGWPDVAVAQRGADQIAVYPNLQGQLGPPMDFPVGDGPELLAYVEPFGQPELVVLQTGYLSRDVITFDVAGAQPIRRLPLVGPTWVAVADYADDGTEDLFVLDGAAGQVRVFAPSAAAGLDEVAAWEVEPGSRVLRALEPGLSGARYLVGESERASTTLFSGPGIPERGRSWFVGDDVRDLLLADFDGDGADEQVYSLPSLDALQVMRPLGEGYLAHETFRTPRTPGEFSLRNRGASPPEVSVLCTGSGEVVSYRVEGNSLVEFETIAVDEDAIRHLWVDFDQDGRDDLVTLVARRGMQTFRNNGGGFDPPVEYVVDGELRDLHAMDLRGSPEIDLLVANSTLVGVLVYEGDGAGGFALADTVTASDAPARVRSADLDLDGLDDLVVLGVVGQVAIFFRRESGLSPPVSYAVSDEPRDADFGDFNGDAYPDIIVGNAAAGTYSTILSVVQGIYTPGTIGRVTPSGAQRVFATDIDDNGQDDIVFASPSSQYLAYHLNTGTSQDPTGVFTIPLRIRAAVLPLDFTFLDVDGDDRRDILVADAASNVIVVLRTDPSSLAGPVSITVEGNRTPAGVELTLEGTAATSAEFEVTRERDGRRLTPSRLGPGAWRVADTLAATESELYRVWDRSQNLLASFRAPAGTAAGDSRDWRMSTPRRVDGATEIRFRVDAGRRPEVRIYDLRGRQVISLPSREEGEGWHRATWAGQDDRGRPVARGRYFAVVEVGNRTLRAPLLHRH